jgi:hypothetical protein
MWKIYENNDEDLSFAVACLYRKVIELDEFKKWVEQVINDTPIDNIPLYIFELLNFNQHTFHIHEVIGFPLTFSFSKKEEDALYGILFLRNKECFNEDIVKEKALRLIYKHPEILSKFKRQFPFITDIDEDLLKL